MTSRVGWMSLYSLDFSTLEISQLDLQNLLTEEGFGVFNRKIKS